MVFVCVCSSLFASQCTLPLKNYRRRYNSPKQYYAYEINYILDHGRLCHSDVSLRQDHIINLCARTINDTSDLDCHCHWGIPSSRTAKWINYIVLHRKWAYLIVLHTVLNSLPTLMVRSRFSVGLLRTLYRFEAFMIRKYDASSRPAICDKKACYLVGSLRSGQISQGQRK
jgi:hypothetical protein